MNLQVICRTGKNPSDWCKKDKWKRKIIKKELESDEQEPETHDWSFQKGLEGFWFANANVVEVNQGTWMIYPLIHPLTPPLCMVLKEELLLSFCWLV